MENAGDAMLQEILGRLEQTDLRLAGTENALHIAQSRVEELEREKATLITRLQEVSKPPRPKKADHEQSQAPELFVKRDNLELPQQVPCRLQLAGGLLELHAVLASVSVVNFVGVRRLESASSGEKADPSVAPPGLPAAQPIQAPRRPSSGSSTVFTTMSSSPVEQTMHSRGRSWDGRTSFGVGLDRDAAAEEAATTTLELLWKEGGGGGPLRHLQLDANAAGTRALQDQVKAWSQAAGEAATSAAADSQRASSSGEAGEAPPPPAEGEGAAARSYQGAELPAASGPPPACAGGERGEILTDEMLTRLHAALPARLRLSSWNLLYGSKRDGISMQSLYRRAAGRAPTMLLVSDTRGAAFGAFCTEPWKVSPRYYGTGESFVFRLAPEMRIFAWSQLNSFFQYGQADSLSVGGGGHFALWFDEELSRGTSGDCETFCSSSLASSKDFQIVRVEVWGFEAS